ncbi:hypothetical protein NE857_33880 (plasmid) [Nocardiopsis exhalans]|uniref:HicA toxin of toxin-antitoxin n=1 Tax=Nocardiopsis exhalans TaxID=163604 RepID=A0ABY5DJM7_9ACTN|nr:hypothetical protein [Nocardiopsis exhalans]USY23622.1 hypothetical protein NE857_33880 [Nocardiopsis exhalans]
MREEIINALMDKMASAARRQGFQVWRNVEQDSWHFGHDGVYVSVQETPRTGDELIHLLGTLRGLGLVYPEE